MISNPRKVPSYFGWFPLTLGGSLLLWMVPSYFLKEKTASGTAAFCLKLENAYSV